MPATNTGEVETAEAAYGTSRQRIIPADDDVDGLAASVPVRSSTFYSEPKSRNSNQRRSQHLLKFMGLVYGSTVLFVGAFGLWFYSFVSREMDDRITQLRRGQPETGRSTPAHAASDGAAPVGEAAAVDFKKELSDLQAQLTAAQKRLADAEQQNELTSARLKSLAEIAESKPAQPATAATSALPLDQSNPVADASRLPAQPDLVLLKERNRMTGYADEAIATGAREPYERLWKSLDDPRLANLVHAARAEILRVQNFYLSGSRIERFDIPVGDYYPDSATLRDAQLPDDKLIDLLAKESHPWQVRLKAANLLGSRRSTAVGDALVKAIKTDKNLDVVKEATFSFEQMTGYRAKIFEPVSVEAWWAQYNAVPPPPDKIAKKPAPKEEEIKPVEEAPKSKDKKS